MYIVVFFLIINKWHCFDANFLTFSAPMDKTVNEKEIKCSIFLITYLFSDSIQAYQCCIVFTLTGTIWTVSALPNLKNYLAIKSLYKTNRQWKNKSSISIEFYLLILLLMLENHCWWAEDIRGFLFNCFKLVR